MLFENCEKCENKTSSVKTEMIVESSLNGSRYGYVVNFDRFHCLNCGWIWTTEEQRKYNEKELTNKILIEKIKHGKSDYGG